MGAGPLQICLVKIAGDNGACGSIYGSYARPDRLDRIELL